MGIKKSIFKNDKITNEVEFVFEKGERVGEKYNGFFQVSCSSPTCNCQRMNISLSNSEMQKYKFNFDVKKREIISEETSIQDINFAKAFVEELMEEDWQNLYKYFLSYKSKITREMDTDKLKVSFKNRNILGGETVSYNEIFPFSEQIIIAHGSASFLVDDQYCLNPKCDCTNVTLVFVEFENLQQVMGKEPFVALYYYENLTFTILEVGYYNKGQAYATMDKLRSKNKNLAETLKKRHGELRKLYKNRQK